MDPINIEQATNGLIFCQVDDTTRLIQLRVDIGFGHLADIGIKLGQKVITEFNNIEAIPLTDIGANNSLAGKKLRMSVLIQKITPSDSSSVEIDLIGASTLIQRSFGATVFDEDGRIFYVIDVKFRPVALPV